jgi:hypothetical protein
MRVIERRVVIRTRLGHNQGHEFAGFVEDDVEIPAGINAFPMNVLDLEDGQFYILAGSDPVRALSADAVQTLGAEESKRKALSHLTDEDVVALGTSREALLGG